MKYQVIVTDPAAASIEENRLWWAEHDSAEQAHRWYKGIRSTIASLDQPPEPNYALAAEIIASRTNCANITSDLGHTRLIGWST